MSAYVVATYNITNPELYGKYVGKTLPILMKYEGQPVVIDDKNELSEGEARNQVVVLKFPSKEKAWGWINDPEYMEVKKMRHEASKDGFLTVCSEFVTPG
ncbi:DUF1330 domain-containing protein [Candidatus Kapabacteria bacterium]|nr:DUF1330 domain-containing protein [Candidatus Kapabacteria bacterium]